MIAPRRKRRGLPRFLGRYCRIGRLTLASPWVETTSPAAFNSNMPLLLDIHGCVDVAVMRLHHTPDMPTAAIAQRHIRHLVAAPLILFPELANH